MLLRKLDLLFDDPLMFFVLVPTVILALLAVLTFHEFSHGWIAHRLGDDTAQSMGRLSFNPLAHLDRMGSIMLLLVGFGWGKPVPVNPYRLRTDPRAGMAMVAAAGPLSNLCMAGLVSLLFRFDIIAFHSLSTISLSSIFSTLILYIIAYNLILAIFNLLPIAPLDGFKIAIGILPRDWAVSMAKTERYGPMILLILIVLSFYTNLLWSIIGSGVNFFSNIFLGGDLF